MKFLTESSEQTEQLGRQWADALQAGDVIALTGELGSGKTTLVRGVAEGLGVERSGVSSPSFVLVRTYEGRLPIFHVDLYRLEGAPEAASVGVEECYEQNGVTLIEWANQVPEVLPEEFLEIRFEAPTPNTRKLTLLPHGKKYEDRLQSFQIPPKSFRAKREIS
jgi:tRNA threonylcarbamoyladenosine biosynthesis protein TsaE